MAAPKRAIPKRFRRDGVGGGSSVPTPEPSWNPWTPPPSPGGGGRVPIPGGPGATTLPGVLPEKKKLPGSPKPIRVGSRIVGPWYDGGRPDPRQKPRTKITGKTVKTGRGR